MWSVSDWRGDELYLKLDNREKGIYRELIDQCWIAGSISSDPEDLARFVGEPLDYFARVWSKIRKKFRSRGEELISKRLEEDRRRLKTLRKKRKFASKKASEMRWKEKRITVPKTKEIYTQRNAIRTPHGHPDTDTDTEGTQSLLKVPLVVLPSVRKEARHSGRTDDKKQKEFQKFWGPVEGYIRGQVVRESFLQYYAGIRIIDMSHGYVVLGVPRALIERSDGAGTTAKLLAHTIEKSGTDLLRDRALRVLPLEDLD
jgi:uncharacterized protein YdaU (DUF1376 family)